jgi:hypothetical protein
MGLARVCPLKRAIFGTQGLGALRSSCDSSVEPPLICDMPDTEHGEN